MLVLTRKVNQQIRLGDHITITVLRVQGNSIRIGVDAPREVRVVRGELGALPDVESGNTQIAGSMPNPQAEASSEVGISQVADSAEQDCTDRRQASSDTNSMMLEFDLDDVDAETLEVLQNAAELTPERPRLYKMRTKAPLAGFLRSQVSEAVSTYSCR